MGTDGFIHGLTSAGGAFGQGALYRVRPDGKEYAAIDLDGSMLPAGSYDSRLVTDDSLLIEGITGFFYFTTDNGSLVNVGDDGRLVLARSWNNIVAVLPVPTAEFETTSIRDSRDVLMVTSDGSGIRVRVKGGDIISRWVSIPGLRYTPLQAVKGGIIAFVADTATEGIAGHFIRIKLLTGGVPSFDKLGSITSSQMPDGDIASRFVNAQDNGTVYFTAGPAVPGGGGSTLLSLSPTSPARILAGFEGGTLRGWTSRTTLEAFGSTESSRIYIPHDGSNPWSPTWMDPSKAASYDVVAGPRNTGSWFRILPAGGELSGYPVANIDVVKPKRAGLVKISPLANDFDTSGRALTWDFQATSGQFARNGSAVDFTPAFTGAGGKAIYTGRVDGGYFPAIGTIIIEGNHSGVYSAPDVIVRNRPLTISVNATGRFTTVVPDASGRPVPVSGTLGNPVVARVSPTETLRLFVTEINNTDPPVRYLFFRISQPGADDRTGYAKLK
ncbi:MAG: hypothetical protein JWO82_1093 [Akkermansiaceae bacterium]|nr:hypothetical protein [Akkermansiaceae bacterium]